MTNSAVCRLMLLLCQMLGVMSLEQKVACARLAERLERLADSLDALDEAEAERWIRGLAGLRNAVRSVGLHLPRAERWAMIRAGCWHVWGFAAVDGASLIGPPVVVFSKPSLA